MKFEYKTLEFHLPVMFKGLSKSYILECIFDESIQKRWKPRVGDLFVGETGNIFCVSACHKLIPECGGDAFFFGGGFCTSVDSNYMDSTYSFIMNQDGMEYYYDTDFVIRKRENPNYSKISKFRYVPYPHENPNYAERNY